MPEDPFFTTWHSLERQRDLRTAATECRRVARVTRGELRFVLARQLIRIAGWLAPPGTPPHHEHARLPH